MLREYKIFCESPSISRINLLLEALLACDINISAHEELFKIWEYGCRRKHHYIQLKTSGSTSGVQRTYNFGPFPDVWIKKLESITKYPSGLKPILIRNRMVFEPQHEAHYVVADENELYYSGYITASALNSNITNEICRILDGLTKPFSLMAEPNVWLYLTSHPTFIEYLVNNKSMINILSTNWEAFYKTKHLRSNGVVINDTMINWYNGINIYTCAYGNYHTYPLFAVNGNKVINLLNLSGHVGLNDDLFIVRNTACSCGKLIVSMIPHIPVQPTINNSFIYNIQLSELLQSKYENLQFIQLNELIDVCYVGDMNDHDRSLIKNFWGGGEFRFRNDTIFKISTKLPVFYKNMLKIDSVTYMRYDDAIP